MCFVISTCMYVRIVVYVYRLYVCALVRKNSCSLSTGGKIDNQSINQSIIECKCNNGPNLLIKEVKRSVIDQSKSRFVPLTSTYVRM